MNRLVRSAVGLVFALPLLVPPTAAHAADPRSPVEEKLVADGLALLRTWTPPVYPPAELKARRGGVVTVRFVVDDTGRVTQARALEDSDSDEKFVEAAVAAVQSWGFSPAITAGQPAAICLDTVVGFNPAVGQEKKSALPPERQTVSAPARSPAAMTRMPPAEYPSVLLDRKLAGTVRFACTVTPEGRATAVRVTAASHVDFVVPALHSVEQWEFKPGMQGDLAVAAEVTGVVTFDAILPRDDETLAANGITAPDGTPPEGAPTPSFVVDPVWPLERLLKGEGGSATVEFTVTETGSVRDVKVREASQPEFGQALRTAVESWGFNRPMAINRLVTMSLAKRAEFVAIPLEAGAADDADPLGRLVRAMRRGEIGGAKGLDEKLTPLYRVRPDYPESLKAAAGGGPKGTAEIEAVIDREGRVRLPRIVSATQEEFGWAAATAVTQWIFKTPRRGGVPVDVKVRIPFEFAAPVE